MDPFPFFYNDFLLALFTMFFVLFYLYFHFTSIPNASLFTKRTVLSDVMYIADSAQYENLIFSMENTHFHQFISPVFIHVSESTFAKNNKL